MVYKVDKNEETMTDIRTKEANLAKLFFWYLLVEKMNSEVSKTGLLNNRSPREANS